MHFTETKVPEPKADCLKRFHVVIPFSDFNESLNAQLVRMGKTVQLQGFRAGKAPVSVLMKRYGNQVKSQVLQESITRVIQDIRLKHKFRSAGDPLATVDKLEDNQDIELDIAFDLMPEFKLADFKGITISQPVATPTDAEVDESIEALGQRVRTTKTVVKKTIEKGDLVEVEYRLELEGVETGRKWRRAAIEIGKEQVAPNFDEKVRELAVGETRVIDVTFPEDDQMQMRAGKSGKLQTRLLAVKVFEEIPSPEVIAKRINLETVDELRERVRASLVTEATRMSRELAKRALLDEIDTLHPIKAPEILANREFEAVWREVHQAHHQGRLDPDDIGKSEEQLRQDYREISDRRVRLGLVMSDVGNVYGIKATDQDVNAAITAEAQRDPASTQAIMDHFRRSEEARERLRAPILEEKVTNFLLDLVGKKDVEVGLTELRKMWREGDTLPVASTKDKKDSGAAKKSAKSAKSEKSAGDPKTTKTRAEGPPETVNKPAEEMRAKKANA